MTDQHASNGGVDAQMGTAHFLGGWFLGSLASTIVAVSLHGSTGDAPIWVLAVSLLAGWAVFLAAMWHASTRHGTGDFVTDHGVMFRPIDLLGLGIGVAAQFLLLEAVYAPLRAVWPDTFDTDALSETANDLVDRASGFSTVVLVLAVVIGAPLVEELFYRGLLQRSLLQRFPPAVVVVAVAAIFAVIHFRPVEYPGLFAAGLVFGVCAWATGRLGMAIACHVGFNGSAMIIALTA